MMKYETTVFKNQFGGWSVQSVAMISKVFQVRVTTSQCGIDSPITSFGSVVNMRNPQPLQSGNLHQVECKGRAIKKLVEKEHAVALANAEHYMTAVHRMYVPQQRQHA
jgi:hypothetical protein